MNKLTHTKWDTLEFIRGMERLGFRAYIGGYPICLGIPYVEKSKHHWDKNSNATSIMEYHSPNQQER